MALQVKEGFEQIFTLAREKFEELEAAKQMAIADAVAEVEAEFADPIKTARAILDITTEEVPDEEDKPEEPVPAMVAPAPEPVPTPEPEPVAPPAPAVVPHFAQPFFYGNAASPAPAPAPVQEVPAPDFPQPEPAMPEPAPTTEVTTPVSTPNAPIGRLNPIRQTPHNPM